VDGKVISYSHETIEEPCDGFMVWIEGEKKVMANE